MAVNQDGVCVGERYRDNDKRMGGRVLVVAEVFPCGCKAVREGSKGFRTYLTGKFHRDGKPRRYGFSLITERSTP